MQVQWALVGSLSEVVFVCLSITGIRLKYKGLRIVYVSCSTCPLFFTLALMMEDSSEIDDDGRPENECRDTEDGRVLNRGMKDGTVRK